MTAMRSRSIFLVASCLLVLLPSLVSAQTSVSLQSGDDQAHLRWLSETLTSVQAIKAGMTRRDLLTIFKQDGRLRGTIRTTGSRAFPNRTWRTRFSTRGF